MINKKLMKEADFTDESGRKFVLKYYILSNGASSAEEQLFGIEIEKRQNTSVVESEDTGWIPFGSDEVTSIVELLAKNEVTPVALTSLMDDMIIS